MKLHHANEIGRKLVNIFYKIKSIIDNKVRENGAQCTAFGLFGVFNYPIYYFIWLYFSKQPYSNLWLRIIATALCIGLLANKYWPEKAKQYLSVYWYITLTYCLPFFFTFMLIRNDFSSMWFANSILVFYFLILLVDFKSFVVLFLIGTGLGVSLAYVLPHPSTQPSQAIDYFGIIITYLVSFIIGGTFAHNREKIEQAKLQTMKALGATVAHELRTPLVAIKFGISGVKEYFPSLVNAYLMAKKNQLEVAPIQTKHLQILSKVFDNIDAEIKYANTIINMILMNVKQNGTFSADFKALSMNDCIEEAMRRYPFKKGEMELIEWSPKNNFYFRGDSVLMVHILFNLMKNAFYFIEAAGKGKIKIWLTSIEGKNVLYFKDTSQGIEENVIPKLFEKFYTTTHHGTGLGLAYCKMVMMRFGGTISCKSQLGEFTQFEMIFPKINRREEHE